MVAKKFLVIPVVLMLALPGCSDQTTVEPRMELQPASDVVTLRPIHDFLSNQGMHCFGDGAGGCELIDAPVPNFLCWCDPASGVMASFDYAALAEAWIQDASSGHLSCGTGCRGQVIEVPEPDGSARVSVVVEAKATLTWAEQGRPTPKRFGAKAVDVVAGAYPALGTARLEVEFSIPYPGAPLPDLMRLLYAPEPGQEVHVIKFHGQADGFVNGKAARLEVLQEGLSLSPAPGPMGSGLPALITLHVSRGRGAGPSQGVR